MATQQMGRSRESTSAIQITSLLQLAPALALGQIDGCCAGRGLVVLVDGIGDHQLQGVEVLGLAKLAQPVALVTQFFNRGM